MLVYPGRDAPTHGGYIKTKEEEVRAVCPAWCGMLLTSPPAARGPAVCCAACEVAAVAVAMATGREARVAAVRRDQAYPGGSAGNQWGVEDCHRTACLPSFFTASQPPTLPPLRDGPIIKPSRIIRLPDGRGWNGPVSLRGGQNRWGFSQGFSTNVSALLLLSRCLSPSCGSFLRVNVFPFSLPQRAWLARSVRHGLPSHLSPNAGLLRAPTCLSVWTAG